jgi:integrase
MKRGKTKYPGVYFRMQKKLGLNTAEEKVYYLIYRLGGRGTKLIEEPVGRESEGMTAAKASKIRSDRARRKEPTNKERRKAMEAAKRAEEARPTIARLWHLYDETTPHRKARDSDTGRYTMHLAPFFSNKTPDELVTLDIDRLRIKKLKTLAPQTVKHILALLRRLINFGAAKGFCPMPDPSRLRFVFPTVNNQKTENLTREQMAAYLAALDEEPDQSSAAFVRLAIVTGMRKGALMALRWDAVDFEHGFITLSGEHAKNGKTVRIPMSKAARTVLERVEWTSSPYIFPGKDGQKRKDYRTIAQRVRDKAGLPKDFRPLHGLRHTFASWLASSGAVDLYTLQKLLTHGSTHMTQRYAHLADEALQRAAAVASELFQEVSGDKSDANPLLDKKRK